MLNFLTKNKREARLQKITGQLSYLKDSLATDCPAFDLDSYFFFIIFRNKRQVNGGIDYRGFDSERLIEDIRGIKKEILPAAIKEALDKIVIGVQAAREMSLSLNGELLKPSLDTKEFAYEKSQYLLTLIQVILDWRPE